MRTFLKPITALVTVSGVMIAFAVGLAALPTRAADHLDAPGVTGDGRTDINDVYAFQSFVFISTKKARLPVASG